jgi:hypothetical protein
MNIYPQTHELCNLEMIRMLGGGVNLGSGHVFVVMGAHMGMLTPINGSHS